MHPDRTQEAEDDAARRPHPGPDGTRPAQLGQVLRHEVDPHERRRRRALALTDVDVDDAHRSTQDVRRRERQERVEVRVRRVLDLFRRRRAAGGGRCATLLAPRRRAGLGRRRPSRSRWRRRRGRRLDRRGGGGIGNGLERVLGEVDPAVLGELVLCVGGEAMLREDDRTDGEEAVERRHWSARLTRRNGGRGGGGGDGGGVGGLREGDASVRRRADGNWRRARLASCRGWRGVVWWVELRGEGGGGKGDAVEDLARGGRDEGDRLILLQVEESERVLRTRESERKERTLSCSNSKALGAGFCSGDGHAPLASIQSRSSSSSRSTVCSSCLTAAGAARGARVGSGGRWASGRACAACASAWSIVVPGAVAPRPWEVARGGRGGAVSRSGGRRGLGRASSRGV